MLQYVTDTEYKSLMGTSSVPSNFYKLAIEASNYINTQTFNRVENNVSEQIKYVTCLIINLIQEAEKKKSEMGNLKSQNIEGWSETYQTAEEIDAKLEKDKYDILKTYLSNVIGSDGYPLLYCGVC